MNKRTEHFENMLKKNEITNYLFTYLMTTARQNGKVLSLIEWTSV